MILEFTGFPPAVVNCHISVKKIFLYRFPTIQNHFTSADAVPMHWEENVQNLAATTFFVPRPAMIPNESFFGLGDKPTEFNLRGKRVTELEYRCLFILPGTRIPLYRSIPFYISLNEDIAHGIFFRQYV